MADVMSELRRDHENVALMLNLLARELDAVKAAARTVDFDLMHDIMVYMTHYPDNVHHPKEDLMFERMRMRRVREVEAVLEELEREHSALGEKGAAFRELLHEVVDGALVDREALEAAGRDYVDFLRYHMEKEDARVFPVAERTLEAEDWQRVRERFASQQDPVFGPVVERQYEDLLEAIRKEGG